MLKSVYQSLTFAALALFYTLPSCAQNQADIIDQAELSLLKIEIVDSGLGSGFVVTESGIAVTNAHVIAGATNGQAFAKFPNGQQYKITGTYLLDEGRDIAIIQLDGSSFTPLSLASNLPRKGEEVMALGSPMGLSFTATRGIISAIRSEYEMRSETGDDSFRGTWVQVDAALSPGNSGGPLISLKGEVVGMSTRASLTSKAQNLNFGISVMDIREAMEEGSRNALVALSDGAAKLENETSLKKHIAGNGNGQRFNFKRVDVPAAAIKKYALKIEKDYALLKKALRRELAIQKDNVKSIRIEDNFFYSKSELNEALIQKELLIRDITEVLKTVGQDPTKQGVLAFAHKYGSPVDLRQKGSVGFILRASNPMVINENIVRIRIGREACLLWTPDTSGLSLFRDFTPGPVFVAGAIPITESGWTETLLIAVSEEELQSAILGEAESGALAQTNPTESMKPTIGVRTSSVRDWSDKTGKFQITASLIDFDGKEVVLRKDDGKIIRVAFDKLCEADRVFLKQK